MPDGGCYEKQGGERPAKTPEQVELRATQNGRTGSFIELGRASRTGRANVQTKPRTRTPECDQWAERRSWAGPGAGVGISPERLAPVTGWDGAT